MPVTYPNRVCTCGYRRFRERRTPSTQVVERWMLFETTVASGFGSTPFGTFFGASSGGTWGKFEGTLKSTTLDVICESCQRVRSSSVLGGITPFATYIQNGFMYVIASDVTVSTCFLLRFTGPDGVVYDSPLSLLPGEVPPAALVSEEPPETADTPPPGAVIVDDLLRARIPEVFVTGSYTVTLVDRCCGCETTLVTVTLEVPAMLLSPLEADIGAAPREWLDGQYGVQPSMPASGSRLSVPFDKCVVVHEFDGRFGTLPDVQGWAHSGSGVAGDYALVEGGALRGITTLTSLWSKTTVVAASPGSVYGYARIASLIDTPHTGQGDGPSIYGQYAVTLATPYHGLWLNQAARLWYATALGGGSDVAVSTDVPRGWTSIAAVDENAGNREQVWGNLVSRSLASAIFGTTGSAGALDVTSRFGDLTGDGTDALYESVVLSYGGRFIRAFFNAYAPVTNPVVRLYLVADSNVSVSKTARFRIRAGVITANPYLIPAVVADATINFATANVVVETAFNLTGLTAELPMWFSVERVWDHGDDDLTATVHLLQLSVRSS